MKLAADGSLMPQSGFSRLRANVPGGGRLYRSSDGLVVVSSIANMELPGGDGAAGPTWLITVSYGGRPGGFTGRPKLDEMMRVVTCFAMPAWDEDNHFPGVARGLFCPVEERWRNECECKVNEMVVVDPADGYAWTTDPAKECRGCQYRRMVARLGRDVACPLHPPVRQDT
jgi:hypothetical protein